MRKTSILLVISALFFLNIKNIYSIENKILLKVNNEIITSIDVFKESNYLIAINSDVSQMSKEEVYKISINSLIRQKIKKLEILKNIPEGEINVDEKYLEQLTLKSINNLGFKNKNDFIDHLKKFNLDISFFKDKISTESLWNELVFQKFSKKVNIDEEKLRKKIINENNKIIKSYLLSEIVFKISASENIDKKFENIKKDIIEKGFSSAVLLHSISNTTNNKGNLGWISDGSLNKKIRDSINTINVGDFTEPMPIPGGFLILKLEDVRKSKNEYDIEKKLNELIRYNTNQQLNQLSNIYYDKVKREITINEL
tara:strand:+ start:672 stop:1610 length:939 start_codon:yes stop_codon:yes gene_type:complete